MAEMTVADTPPWVQYQADGAQAAFTFPFPVLSAADLQVVFDAGAAPGAHTIDGVGNSEGGTVIFPSPPPAGTRITLYRDMPVARTSDFTEAGDFRASALNAELDALAMMVQQVEAAATRALAAPAHDTLGEPLTLPGADARADSVLAFDADGRATALSDLKATAEDALNAASSAADSADAAAVSATEATDAAGQAQTSANAAANDAATAGTAASDADDAATLAQGAAGDADAAAASAQTWADAPEDTEVAAGAYSARHWAAKAADSATALATALPDERRRVDLATQRLAWRQRVPSVVLPPVWAVDFTLGLGLDALIVSRAGPGTFHDAQGLLRTAPADTLRLDHDPDTGEPLGALVEAERTNLLHDSFNPATQTRSLAAGTYTASMKGTGSLELSGAVTGTATQGAPVTFTLAAAGDVTFTPSGTVAVIQCEDGGNATSLIETPADGPATRAADAVLASDFDWYAPAHASVVIAADFPDVPTVDGSRLLSLDDGGDANRHNVFWNQGSAKLSIFTKSAGASQSSLSTLTGGGWADGERHSIGLVLGNGRRGLFNDGAKAAEDTIADPVGLTTLRLGSFHAGQPWKGHIRWAAVWARHLSDAEMSALTA